MSLKKLDSRTSPQQKVKLSSLQAEDMERLGVTKKDLNKMCWSELSRRLKLEECDYSRNKNIYNSLRVVARDIFLLVKENFKAIAFKGAVYNEQRNKVELGFKNISELPSFIKRESDIDSNDVAFMDLALAVETFTTIRKEKRLNLPKHLSFFYTDRYQMKVLPINTIQDPLKKTQAINSITSFESNQAGTELEATEKPLKATDRPEVADTPPYEDKATEKPVEAIQEPGEGETVDELDEFELPPIENMLGEESIDKERTMSKLRNISSKLRGDKE